MVKIKTNDEFIKEVEKLVVNNKLDFFEAVLYYCEKNNIEVETAASIIKQNSVLKAKIQLEAENLNLVRRSGRLPI